MGCLLKILFFSIELIGDAVIEGWVELMTWTDPDAHHLGQYMVFIPLGISAIQIAVGIIVKTVMKKKN